ncbi:MAG: hypothetical protein ACW97A_02650 [Candidatus Thorarchaeota archaeon]|jgi:hypothetical protein
MGYQHKDDTCCKETKEILENVLCIKKEEYEFLEGAETIEVESPTKKILQEESEVNVLPSETEEMMSEVEKKDVSVPSSPPSDLEDLENYTPTQEAPPEAVNAKEIFEKKRKKRSYLEFREEYEVSEGR